MNITSITGRLTHDPELRATADGTKLSTLRIASARARTRDVTDFFDVTVWRGLAETCAEHLEKGRLVHVVGEMQYREWKDDDGNHRRAYEVQADNVQFLGGRPGDPAPATTT